MLTDVPGVLVGHHTDHVGRTGCTVVLLPEGSVASGEVRGGAPGTREFDLLDPIRVVPGVDAVLFTGGSAFGLAAADGVMRWCEEHGRGFATRHARVPIVVAAVIYDLGVGSAAARPRPDDGYDACMAARGGTFAVGSVGAGAGATQRKWRGADNVRPGGVGTATVRSDDVIVSALMIANPVGDILSEGAMPDDAGSIVASMRELRAAAAAEAGAAGQAGASPRENTTIGIVVTNAKLDKVGCHLLAQSGHDGIARAIWPAHLTGDGDAIVAVSVAAPDGVGVDAPLDAVRALACEAVAQALGSVGSLIDGSPTDA